LSYTSYDENTLYGYLRLRFNDSNYGVLPVIHDTALIRELHVLGVSVTVNNADSNKTQHKKLGTNLLKYAEYISMLYGYKKIAIISGVGVRTYYEKRGYNLSNTYMVKTLNPYMYIAGIILFIMFLIPIIYLIILYGRYYFMPTL
jgi:histone acetyltransferase (RNA polymerase elongator complex component)